MKVLRGRAGDIFEVVDAGGRLFYAELLERGEAAVREQAETNVSFRSGITLYQAVPKGKHMDLVVEKAVELGVELIVPVISEHGVAKVRDGGRAERWRRISESAARQSLQLRVPEVSEPVEFRDAVVSVVAENGETRSAVLLHNDSGLKRLEQCVEDSGVSLFVGPEGGWSEEEIKLSLETGFRIAQLGPYRLRSETAGIVAVARAQAALEVSVARGGV